jgi:hypothetical protein
VHALQARTFASNDASASGPLSWRVFIRFPARHPSRPDRMIVPDELR